MNEQNIQIVQKIYQDFGKRDIPAVLAALSHDVVWSEPANPFNPAGGTRYGHAGFLEWAQIGNQSEDIIVLEPRKILAQNDIVVVTGYMKCRAKATGNIYESDFVHLVTIQDGKVTRFQEFFDTYIAGEAFRINNKEKYNENCIQRKNV
jgi:ketosteroid isomerase-like protein